MTPLGRLPISPDSRRGQIAVAVMGCIAEAKRRPAFMSREAEEHGMTPDQLLAAIITEAVLGVVGEE